MGQACCTCASSPDASHDSAESVKRVAAGSAGIPDVAHRDVEFSPVGHPFTRDAPELIPSSLASQDSDDFYSAASHSLTEESSFVSVMSGISLHRQSSLESRPV